MIDNIKKVGIVTGLALGIYSCSSTGKALENCLHKSEAKLYWADWSGFCHQQKEILGKSFKYVDKIDYDLNREECDRMGIKDYPTWSINGKNYPGSKSLEILSDLTGCEFIKE